MNPKEEKECRKAFEILTHKKKELDEMLDEMYNDIEQEKFMEKSGGLKNG
jgi:hypothetical protein